MILPARTRGAAAEFERRSKRAEKLAASGRDPEPLCFAAGLLRAQAAVAVALEIEQGARALSGKLVEDLDRILEALRVVPRSAARQSPEPLAAQARARAAEDAATARQRLVVFWGGGQSALEDYFSRAMLRPYLEILRLAGVAPDRARPRGRCPFCGGGPSVGALRDGAAGQGAGRFLFCSLCGLEWAVPRILCAACGERDPARLPSFSSPTHSAVRLDTCDTCRRYLKTLDLSLDARPLPEVDDLASIALDLWASEQGYVRIEPGLAGI